VNLPVIGEFWRAVREPLIRVVVISVGKEDAFPLFTRTVHFQYIDFGVPAKVGAIGAMTLDLFSEYFEPDPAFPAQPSFANRRSVWERLASTEEVV
jgi:hypothetical protein